MNANIYAAKAEAKAVANRAKRIEAARTASIAETNEEIARIRREIASITEARLAEEAAQAAERAAANQAVTAKSEELAAAEAQVVATERAAAAESARYAEALAAAAPTYTEPESEDFPLGFVQMEEPGNSKSRHRKGWNAGPRGRSHPGWQARRKYWDMLPAAERLRWALDAWHSRRMDSASRAEYAARSAAHAEHASQLTALEPARQALDSASSATDRARSKHGYAESAADAGVRAAIALAAAHAQRAMAYDRRKTELEERIAALEQNAEASADYAAESAAVRAEEEEGLVYYEVMVDYKVVSRHRNRDEARREFSRQIYSAGGYETHRETEGGARSGYNCEMEKVTLSTGTRITFKTHDEPKYAYYTVSGSNIRDVKCVATRRRAEKIIAETLDYYRCKTVTRTAQGGTADDPDVVTYQYGARDTLTIIKSVSLCAQPEIKRPEYYRRETERPKYDRSETERLEYISSKALTRAMLLEGADTAAKSAPQATRARAQQSKAKPTPQRRRARRNPGQRK